MCWALQRPIRNASRSPPELHFPSYGAVLVLESHIPNQLTWFAGSTPFTASDNWSRSFLGPWVVLLITRSRQAKTLASNAIRAKEAKGLFLRHVNP